MTLNSCHDVNAFNMSVKETNMSRHCRYIESIFKLKIDRYLGNLQKVTLRLVIHGPIPEQSNLVTSTCYS